MQAPHRRSKFLSLAAHGAAQKRAVQEENIPEATTGEMPRRRRRRQADMGDGGYSERRGFILVSREEAK